MSNTYDLLLGLFMISVLTGVIVAVAVGLAQREKAVAEESNIRIPADNAISHAR